MTACRARPREATPRPRSAAAAGRSYPTSQVRGGGGDCQAVTVQEPLRGATPLEARVGGREEQPHIQGAVPARVPEGLVELFHVEGWEERP